MSKVVILILSGLAIFGVALAVFYYISAPVMNLSMFKSNLGAQSEINKVIWAFIVCISVGITAAFLRLLYEILFKRRKK